MVFQSLVQNPNQLDGKLQVLILNSLHPFFQHHNFAAIDVISINKLNFDYCQLEMLIRLQLIDIKFLKEFEKILSSNQWLTSKVSWIAFYYQELIFCRS